MGGARLDDVSSVLPQRGDVQSMVECRMSMPGTRHGIVRKKRRKCPQRKSAAKSDISTILTRNSRAGCEKADEPSPRPYPAGVSTTRGTGGGNSHRPVHHARFVSSCLNSRERKTAIMILNTARWMLRQVSRAQYMWTTHAMVAIMPSTAWLMS